MEPFLEACCAGNLENIKSVYNQLDDINKGMSFACLRGHIDVVKFLIEEEANDLRDGMFEACKGGHIDIVKLMISKNKRTEENGEYFGRIEPTRDWNEGMRLGCLEGHMNIVKFMIEKGANNWGRCLVNACTGGYMNVVKFMIEKGRSFRKLSLVDPTIDWKNGFESACLGGHTNIVKLMISESESRTTSFRKISFDWNNGFQYAFRKWHVDIMKLMISKSQKHRKKSMIHWSLKKYMSEKFVNCLSFSELLTYIKLNFIPLNVLKMIQKRIYIMSRMHVSVCENLFPVLERFLS